MEIKQEEFWFVLACYTLFPIVFPPLIYGWTLLLNAEAKRWWQSQSAFRPPALVNFISLFSYISCAVAGKFIARWALDRELYYTGSFRPKDLANLVAFLLILDLVSYVVHRIQHHPWFYRWSHATHHQVKFVSIWASFYANPLDYLSTTAWLPLVLHYFFEIHYLSDAFVALVSTLTLVTIHSDYRNITNGHHALHHLDPRFNFSGNSIWMDRLFGTLMTVEKYSQTRKLDD